MEERRRKKGKRMGLLLASFFVLLFSFFALQALDAQAQDAAQLYLDLQYFQEEEAKDFSVRILVNSEEEINAYDITFAYPAELLTLKRVDTSRSIVTVLPGEIEATADGRVIIKGGSAQPFSGEAGEIATLHFSAVATGSGNLGFVSAVVHRADGSGTPLVPAAYQAPLRIVSLAKQSEGGSRNKEEGIPLTTEPGSPNYIDTTAPMITTLKIVENPLEKTYKLLIFEAQDEDSGVSHFLVRERRWLLMSNYARAFNPHPIASGAWAIELTAVDRYGNEVSETIYRWNIFLWKTFFVAVIILAGWFIYWLYRHWFTGKKEENGVE